MYLPVVMSEIASEVLSTSYLDKRYRKNPQIMHFRFFFRNHSYYFIGIIYEI